MQKIKSGKDIKISDDGRYVITAFSPTEIKVWKFKNTHLKLVAETKRVANTDFCVKGNNLVYVRADGCLVTMHDFDEDMSTEGKTIKNPSCALIGYRENGEPIIFQMTESKMSLIKDYVIRHDTITDKILLICKYFDGNFRTVVLEAGKLAIDKEDVSYSAEDLSLIQFYNGIILIPNDGKITAFSYEKGVMQDLFCAVVKKNSKLIFKGNGLEIVNNNTVYRIKKINEVLQNLKED